MYRVYFDFLIIHLELGCQLNHFSIPYGFFIVRELIQCISAFDFKLSDEHYCRYRNVDGEQCCDRDDQSCYTDAGCFCDEACYTIYGDCCQDHWVTCYDDLKLCLTPAASKLKTQAPSYFGLKCMWRNHVMEIRNLLYAISYSRKLNSLNGIFVIQKVSNKNSKNSSRISL